jgi:ArsR family transcriptional regulator, arsenate/arsenite/antimonite-responsive transcriptional repressor / arsenate reductase (thioredoxin)
VTSPPTSRHHPLLRARPKPCSDTAGPAEVTGCRLSKFHQTDLIYSSGTRSLKTVEPLHTPLGTDEPPVFVGLVAHPLRWRLLRELARSDRAVWELTELVNEAQNLVSYHLRQLRDGGLVFAHRSAADGRDAYYSIDLARCQTQLQAAGGALHPALRLAPMPRPSSNDARPDRRRRVLFLCTGNSARSQIAEALLDHMSEATIEAASAGSHPKPLHPNAVRVLAKRGIDISANRTKHLDEFRSQRFDMVITLCDRVREVCPEFPSKPQLVHWSIPDPALAGPTNRVSYPAFERTTTELETRITFLLHVLADPPTRRSINAEQ